MKIFFNAIDGYIAICRNEQSNCLSESFGGGHGDDTFGEEGGGGEERTEEDEEPDA